jgi:protein TonB
MERTPKADVKAAQVLLVAIAILMVRTSAYAADVSMFLDKRRAKAVVVYAPRPDYPFAARQRRLTGRGIFRLGIDRKTGAVLSASTVKSTGHTVLDRAALDAFLKWRFKPGTAHYVIMPISFAIEIER